jgi:hypothetical protein
MSNTTPSPAAGHASPSHATAPSPAAGFPNPRHAIQHVRERLLANADHCDTHYGEFDTVLVCDLERVLDLAEIGLQRQQATQPPTGGGPATTPAYPKSGAEISPLAPLATAGYNMDTGE